MQRRRFIYSALSITSFLISSGILNSNINSAYAYNMSSDEQVYDWIFLYWMPYDNNLYVFGKPILEMLTKGVQTKNILVLVQSKLSGEKNLSRQTIIDGKINSQNIDAIDSSSEEVFAEYLQWAKSKYNAKKWAIIILGHGGTLDTVSPDDHPDIGFALEAKTKWMNIQKLSEVIAKFNQEIDNRVELFFFQNCKKSTLEASYSFKDAAKYTLASQLILGAPNYYYENLLKFIGQNPEINGGQLAEKIIQFEASEMYHSYTAINNNALRNLPEKVNPLIQAIVSSNPRGFNTNQLVEYYSMGDRFVDVGSFFERLTIQSGIRKDKYQEFIDFLQKSLIYKFDNKGTLLDRDKEYDDFSGLGIFLPTKKQELEKYSYLPVYRELKLLELFDKILVS